MSNSTISRLLTAVLLLATACDSGSQGKSSATASEEKPAKSGKPAATTSAALASASAAEAKPAGPPEVLAIKAGKMKDPQGGGAADVKLVDTPMDKCYGFKGYSMKLPEGSSLETLVGARACAVYPPATKKKSYGLIVMTDEIKVQFADKSKLEGVKTKHLDEPDAFMFEREVKGKTVLTGWVDRKVGPYRTQCNAFQASDKDPAFTLGVELAFIEVCRTLSYSEPPKK